MTDTPGREPEPGPTEPEQRLPAVGRPPRSPRSSASPRRRSIRTFELTPRACRAGRAPVVERALGRLPRDRRRHPVRRDLLVLRARPARRPVEPRLGRRSRGPAGHAPSSAATTCTRRTARAATAWTARAASGPIAQPAGQAVRAPERGLHPQRPDASAAGTSAATRTRRCRSGPTRQSARAAELPADRGAHRVPDGDQRPGLHRPRRAPARPEDRPGHRRGPDLHRLARPELRAGPGRDAVPGLLDGRVHRPAGRQRRRPAPRPTPSAHRGRRSSISSRSASRSPRRPSRSPAEPPFTIHFDNQDAGIPHNVEIKDAAGGRRLQGRDLPGRRRHATTRCRRSRPGLHVRLLRAPAT